MSSTATTTSDVNMNATQGPGYTILRIKRKRDEDVPDLLVVEPTLKKGFKRRKSGLDVFQFAETVDAAAWKDVEQDELRDRLSKLSKAAPDSPQKNQTDTTPTAPDVFSRHSSSQTQARQYRVIGQDESEHDRQSSRFSAVPPKVLSSKDLEQSSSKLRIYDAVLAPPEPEVEVDPEMEKFQLLVQDYLTVNDSISSQAIPDSQPAQQRIARNVSGLSRPSSGEFVYDIFYHRPSTLSEMTVAANMATVTGLPPAFDDDYDPDSEEEEEDEADEDSNAEDFYRNDYPDEESFDGSESGSDMFHDYSDDELDGDGRFQPGF
ncbi:hypothetical protein DFH11DRAFT_1595123 [Phellopilus nigrolimitatus]|nr:hypothetical protein DFH11DRAFT_1595123 [Phellopilus nigrolimitatus]